MEPSQTPSQTPTMDQAVKQPGSFPDRLKQFDAELKELMGKYEIKGSVSLDFPQFKILPDEVQLAQLVLQKAGAIMYVKYEDNSPVPKKPAETPVASQPEFGTEPK